MGGNRPLGSVYLEWQTMENICSFLSKKELENSLDFVQYVMSIDPQKKMNTYGKGKYLLRHAFEGDFLPNSILMREKAAFSDAVGHSMVDGSSNSYQKSTIENPPVPPNSRIFKTEFS